MLRQGVKMTSARAPQYPIKQHRLTVNGHVINVALKDGPSDRPPLLLFNGIGANWQLAEPFMDELTQTRAIIFDIPGVGGSAKRLLPYRLMSLAGLARALLRELDEDVVDVLGVSWGGTLAQQFACQYPKICRKLVLAATSAGSVMVPGRPSVLWKMATPRRYMDKNYMTRIAAEIYGGDIRRNPKLIEKHVRSMRNNGGISYLYQMLAIAGWTSLPWLWTIRQPTLVLMGSEDPIVPLINGRILARLIRNARLEKIDDGHLFIVTRPKETASLVENFLGEP